jgi:glucose/arabinose dehydrogenase
MRAWAITAVAVCVGVAGGASAQDKEKGGGKTPGVVASSAGQLRVEKLATLEYPWGMAVLPDGRLLITEKPGRLRIFAKGKLSEPLAGVPKVVYRGGEMEQGGLLDVAIDPKFASNGVVYLSYVEAAAQQPSDMAETDDFRFPPLDPKDDIVRGGAVARARLDGDRLVDLKVIWRQVPKMLGRGHFGHRLVFAPDGKLLITSGDRMRFEPAQLLSSNLGKVVRINPDGSTPRDNPFAGKKDARADIWSYGHRNMLAAAVEPRTGRLYVVEMGPMGGDELNLIIPGKNYGWPLVSDGDHYPRPDHPDVIRDIPDHGKNPKYQAPLRTWTPVISPSGALFYSGSLLPQWSNSLLVGSLSGKALVRLTVDGDKVGNEERIDMGRRIRDVAQALDGSLYLLVDDAKGELLRLSPTEAPAEKPAPPDKG